MTSIDYIVIVIYLAFVLMLGPLYRKLSSTASDYFRGGGGMLWWMVGASSFMTTFSAWSFTGAAGRAYEAGLFVMLLFGANVIAFLFTFLVTGPWFRQMRVITPVEAVRKRFGRANEQVFTWLPIPLYLIIGAIQLYAIGIFMAAVFDVKLEWVVIGLGGVVTIMAVMGGAWAVVASDFVQLLIIVVISLVTTILLFIRPEIGGVGGFIQQLPEQHYRLTDAVRPSILIFFAITLCINQLVQTNSMWRGASRFMFCKTGRDARKAAMVALLGFVVFPFIWLMPAMGASILHPNLASEYPNLQHPAEAAYVAVAKDLLPSGMVGLLVCAIFAATMSSLDSSLNRAAGVIVRNFYRSIVNPEITESAQVRIGQILTGALGVVVTAIALMFMQLKSWPIFDLILMVVAIFVIPMAVPLFFGMFVRRVPPWAGWSTALVGLATGLTVKMGVSDEMIVAMVGSGDRLNDLEANSFMIGLTSLVNFLVCLGWFLLTMVLMRRQASGYWRQTALFFRDLRTPIDVAAENVPGWETDRLHYAILGMMCSLYGGMIALLGLLPNPVTGRLAFVFSGGVILLIGVLLLLIRRLKDNQRAKLLADINEQPAGAAQADVVEAVAE
jgi:SSS family transporter